MGKYDKCLMELETAPVNPSLGNVENILPVYSRDIDPLADFRFEVVHLWKEGMGCGFGTKMMNPETGEIQGQWPHTHVADEMYFFIGTNPEDPMDLGGELELWIGAGDDAEKLTITRTSAVRIPAGTPHLPFVVRRVERNFIMCAMPLAPMMHDWEVIPAQPNGVEMPDWYDEADVVWPKKD